MPLRVSPTLPRGLVSVTGVWAIIKLTRRELIKIRFLTFIGDRDRTPRIRVRERERESVGESKFVIRNYVVHLLATGKFRRIIVASDRPLRVETSRYALKVKRVGSVYMFCLHAVLRSSNASLSVILLCVVLRRRHRRQARTRTTHAYMRV